jgi:DNA topoisomerase VI subunit B
LAYGGDINSFKLYRFANKIPLLYDEGSDVAREVVSEVEINKMGITKKQAKEQFSTTNKESKRDRVIEVLPIHIFFHICSTKIPYKTAGKESIASEGELKSYMKSCLSELYRKLSTQIRKELKMKEAENKMKLYKHYLPFIVEAITESLGVKNPQLGESFSFLIEKHLTKKLSVESVMDDSVDESLSSASTSSLEYLKLHNKDKSSIILNDSLKIDAESRKNAESKNNLTIPIQTVNSDTSFTIPTNSKTKENHDRAYKNKNKNNDKSNKNSGKNNKLLINNTNDDSNKDINIKIQKKRLPFNNSKKKINKKRAKEINSTLDSYHPKRRRVNKGK